MKEKRCVGIAIGGTKTAVSFAKFDGKNFSDIEKVSFPTNPNSDAEVLDNIYKAIDSKDYEIEAVSVIVGSPIDVKKGLILTPPHLPGFRKTPIVKLLSERYHCKASLLNDADACALAEFYFGNHEGAHNLIFYTFGTGFGAGLVLNDKIYTGHNGMAGEIGHVRLRKSKLVGYGKKGSVEAFLAGGNIPIFAKSLYKKYPESNLLKYENLTSKDVMNEARNGDKLALKVVDEVAKNLGEVVSMALDIFNPDYVVIGGIYPRCLDLLEKKTLAKARKESLKVNYKMARIVPSSLKEQIDEYSSLAPLRALLED